MDNVILDVLLGLVLIYLVMSLLAMKFQEYLVGDLLRRRVGNLHDLVRVAVGDDDTLRAKIIANPLIDSLSESAKRRSGNVVWAARGPSAIPPELFARALLMELNDGSHPSEAFATPLDFLSSKEEVAKPVWQSLRGLLPGAQGVWPAFESAIATWFTEVGERSKGWWQRESQRWSLLVALALAAALNVDTMFVAERLAEDPSMRRALATLAEQVNSVFGPEGQNEGEGASAGTTPAAVVPRRPALRAAEQIANATANLAEAFADDAVAAFGFDRFTVQAACTENFGTKFDAGHKPKTPVNTKFVSNADTWLNVLPALRAEIGNTAAEPANAPSTLRDAYKCLGHIAAWVGSATTASKSAATRKLMTDATLALDQARTSVLELIELAPNPLMLKRFYLRDPDAFEDCVSVPGTTRPQAEACMLKAQTARVTLPVGHTDENWRMRFCRVARDGEPIKQATLPVCDREFGGNSALGIAKMQLTARGGDIGTLLTWLGGIAITALFVALGAPFWFDVLSKVTKVRAAGRMLDEAEPQRLPAPLPGPHADAGGQREGEDGRGGGTLARNDFERSLLEREIVSVQQRLGVVPASGIFDTETRAAIERKSRDLGLPATNEISLTLYEQVTGRAPSAVPVLREPDRPQRGEPHRLAMPLASKLMTLLEFKFRLSAHETAFSDELRALAVLYRFKVDAASPERDREVFALATDQPEALDEIDDALMNQILARPDAPVLARDAKAPWIDWALGELGQVERNRTAREESDPRICEYLDVVKPALGKLGDTTPWCGAFVAWVVTHYNNELNQHRSPALSTPPASSAAALSWKSWGNPRAAGTPQRGDVVVVKTAADGSRHHVGFCFDADAVHVWLLGGNQARGTRVSLSRFPIGDVEHTRVG
jgi:uncharacterized protein (TIGR02594 family)